MTRYLLFTVLGICSLVFLFQNSFACQCPIAPINKVRTNSIKNSELIFIGEVIETDTVQHIYKIRVLESFKGKLKEIVVGSSLEDSTHYSSCAFWPFTHLGTEFIVYASYAKGTDKIFIDQCSATRSLTNPQRHLSYFTGKYEKMQGMLSKEMTFEEKIKFLKTDNKLRQAAFKDLIDELECLRKLSK